MPTRREPFPSVAAASTGGQQEYQQLNLLQQALVYCYGGNGSRCHLSGIILETETENPTSAHLRSCSLLAAARGAPSASGTLGHHRC